jgi:demethoxyubiquinone hydroxylase (CLK1/Coq7/Cat5 family)
MRNNSYLLMKKFSTISWKPNIPKHKIIIDKTTYRTPHPVWDINDVENVQITHRSPETIKDKVAFYMMKILRIGFDYFSSYRPGKMNEELYIRRCIFLETIAGVPGMIAGAMRHMGSLRSMREDGGWINHLIEEAENERMHLLTFLKIRQPGLITRIAIMWAQLAFICYFSFIYILSSKMAHRFVAYLEEEAVKTYTNLIKELDEGHLPLWKDKPAPEEAIKYWGLPKNATFRDVLNSIRADEVLHREYNHHFADIPKTFPVESHKFFISNKSYYQERKNISKD